MIFKQKLLIILFVFSFFCSCKTEKERTKPFFEYDKVEYYYNGIRDKEFLPAYKAMEGKSEDSKEVKFFKILTKRYPVKLDSNFKSELEFTGYESQNVDVSKFNELNEVFSETKCDSSTANACDPIYRDVLLFYQKDSLIGIAKICFSCRQEYIIGAKTKIGDFGQCGGYEKLSQLLKE